MLTVWKISFTKHENILSVALRLYTSTESINYSKSSQRCTPHKYGCAVSLNRPTSSCVNVQMVSHVKWSFVWNDGIGRWRRENIFCRRSRYLRISTWGNVCVEKLNAWMWASSRAHCANSFGLSLISLSGPARRKCIFILNRIILFRVGEWAMGFFFWIGRLDVYCASALFLLSIMMYWIEFVRQMPFAHVAKIVSNANRDSWNVWKTEKKRDKEMHILFIQRSRLTPLSLRILFFLVFRRKLSHAYLANVKQKYLLSSAISTHAEYFWICCNIRVIDNTDENW